MEQRRDGQAVLAKVNRDYTLTMTISNVIGAVVVTIYLMLLLPVRHTEPVGQVLLWNSWGLLYMPLVIAVMPRWGRKLARKRLGWLLEDRRPTREEQRQTLRNPLVQLKLVAAVWLLTAVLFGLANTHFSLQVGMDVGAGILLGGLVTCAISYLAGERALRPVTARALEAGVPLRPLAPGVLARTLLAWGLATGVSLLAIVDVATAMITGEAPRSDVTAISIIFLAVTGIVAGATAIAFAAKSIAEPVGEVRRALARVEEGRTDVSVEVNDASEIGLLQAGFNRMAAGLREREQLRDLFGRHVGEDVARHALEEGTKLGGELREAGVLFVDVVGSTAMALDLPPQEVVERLNAFFAIVLKAVQAHGGWLNKFEGDGALCVFGVPTGLPDPAGAALAAGRELCLALDRDSPIPAAIGVSAGEVVAGNIGVAERFEYTVIGDPVNEAARLCELAKLRHPRLLASTRALACADQHEIAQWEPGESVVLRGRSSPTTLATPAGATTGEASSARPLLVDQPQ